MTTIGKCRALVIATITTAALAGCATNNTHIAAQMAPRALPADLSVQRIAVMPFRGRGGRAVSDELQANLINHQFNGKPYFTVLDRNRSQSRRLMGEFARNLQGEIDPATAARFGKQIGAQAILFGRVTSNGIERSYYEGSVLRCIRQNSIGLCTKFRRVAARCVHDKARFGVLTKLVNVETAQIVYSKQHTAIAQSDSCTGPMVDDDSLMAAARHKALSEVVPDIAPTNIVLNVPIKTDSSTLTGAAKSQFKGAVAFEKAGRMNRACQIWRSINNSGDTHSVAVVYDLAVCAEAQGKLAEALDMYKTADQRLQAPDSDVDAALKRVRAEIAQRQDLSRIQ